MSSKTKIPFFIANWKMHHGPSACESYLKAFVPALPKGKKFEVGIAPQMACLSSLKAALPSGVELCSQNSGVASKGAFTGEVSPSTLKELGVRWVILGHSERRHYFKETDEIIALRAQAALEEGLGVVFCIGETLAERRADKTLDRIQAQIQAVAHLPWKESNLVFAYEPVWAIGTGENATPQQVGEVHQAILGFGKSLPPFRILYGGSVKKENSGALMAVEGVDGLLVGSASLDGLAFAELIQNALCS